MNIAVIGDEDTVLGFKIAGVKDATVYDKEKANEMIEKYSSAKILIVTENIAAELKEQNLLTKIQGIVAEIPDKGGSTGAALRNIGLLLEQAIGVKLKT